MENKKGKEINIKSLGNKKVVDLIIPLYKAKSTLVRLLSSVSMQTMRENIKVIIVQDCDGEDYSEILGIFNKLLDIEWVSLEENKGSGAARRIGMEKGKSKYITCIDADDTFQNPFAIQELYMTIEKNKADAVNSIFLEEIAECRFCSHENNDWIWMFGKIYRRSFLEKNKIEMNDSRANEDTGFNAIVSSVGKIGFMPDVTYIWHYKEDSITRKDGGIYRFTGIEGWLFNMQYAIDNIVRLNAPHEKIQQFVADNIIATYGWFLEFNREKDERINVKEYIKWVNQYYKKIYIKYKPTEEQLNYSFEKNINSYGIKKAIPTHTFEQYLYIVGEGYDDKQVHS